MSNFIEPLESRQHLSVATKTTITESAVKPILGAAFTITVKESSTSARGTVELLDNNKDTGLTGTLNHKGYVVFSIGPSNALYIGKYEFSARYLSSGNFIGSKSKEIPLTVVAPAVTTESSGIEQATVTAGTGTAAVASGDSVTVQYTGFNAATGAEFDASGADSSTGVATFSVDDPSAPLITGFDDELVGMKVGETRVAVLPESLAYPTGSSSSLAGDTLVFVVHLVSINS